jgi:hypothetical protein
LRQPEWARSHISLSPALELPTSGDFKSTYAKYESNLSEYFCCDWNAQHKELADISST